MIWFIPKLTCIAEGAATIIPLSKAAPLSAYQGATTISDNTLNPLFIFNSMPKTPFGF